MMKFTRVGLLSALVGVAAFVLFFITINRSPLPWGDETLWASTAYSLLIDRTGVPTVLADFPQADRFDLFYGPFCFKLGALAFKLWGFSMSSFRLLSLIGALLLTIGSACLVRVLGGTKNCAAVCFALVAFTPEIGSRATTGRMDTLTVGLEMIGLALLVAGLRSRSEATSWTLCVAAGGLWSLAVLSTPRSFTFFTSVALNSVAFTIMSKSFRDRAFIRLLGAGVTISAAVSLWTISERMTPLRWLYHIALASHGDKRNTSPLLGGSWSLLEPSWTLSVILQAIVTPIGLGLIVIGVTYAAKNRSETERWENFNEIFFWFVLCSVLGNALITLALITRPLVYNIYWTIPALPVMLLATSNIVKHPSQRRSVSLFCYALWVCLALSYAAIRTVKTVEIFESWEDRDPSAIEIFIKSEIPQGSRVYGPPDYYFYAVERAGSNYRYVQEWTTPGLAKRTSATERQMRPAESQQTLQSNFLIWPQNFPLPERFASAREHLIARYIPRLRKRSWLSRFAPPYARGYPVTNLYRIPNESFKVSALTSD